MNWEQLLNAQRLSYPQTADSTRSAFHRDYGRVLYSSAFRRLQDKTQVFPLGRNDYVRTRLTHSLEVSNVGRSLAMELAAVVEARKEDVPGLASAVGDIVATACLAHDIGNPPFGHSGENAIEEAVRDAVASGICAEEFADFRFEGNAQGFRLLTRTCDPIRGRGLDLTAATLAAFAKYPCPEKGYYKKFGINAEDIDTFQEVATLCGLPKPAENTWARHPLAFLMEAADDVSYLIADMEDAFISKIISYDDTVEQLAHLVGFDARVRDSIRKECVRSGAEAAVRYARARAIGACIGNLRDAIEEQYENMMNGTLRASLMSSSCMAAAYADVQEFSKNRIYSHESVVKIEITGFNVIKTLMELFLKWVQNPQHPLSRKIEAVLHADAQQAHCRGYRFRHVVDYISGMTDSFALQTYNTLFGK